MQWFWIEGGILIEQVLFKIFIAPNIWYILVYDQSSKYTTKYNVRYMCNIYFNLNKFILLINQLLEVYMQILLSLSHRTRDVFEYMWDINL